MRAPNAWQTFATSEERKLIDRVLQWRDGEKARVLGQLRAKREEIDKWLEESTDNLA
jgi:hypothetical protein